MTTLSLEISELGWNPELSAAGAHVVVFPLYANINLLGDTMYRHK